MKKFCTACGNVGNPVLVKKGSTGTAFLLWITFLLPGIIYSIWRANSEHEACPACGSPEVIPSESPMARKLMGDDYQTMKDEEARIAAETQRAAEEALRQIRKQEAERMAQPWIKRNAPVLIIVCLMICAMGGTLWSAIIHQQSSPIEAPVQQEIPTAAAPIQKPVHHKKPVALCQVDAGGKLVPCGSAAEREAKCKGDTAAHPFDKSPNCDYPDGAVFPNNSEQ